MPETITTLRDDERQPCEVWSRVMGYHRPISSYNKGKQQEHEDRQHYREPSGLDSADGMRDWLAGESA